MARGQSILSSLAVVIVISNGEIPRVGRTSRAGVKSAMNVIMTHAKGV